MDQDQIAKLEVKLNLLLQKQKHFTIEVNEIRRDIQVLKNIRSTRVSEESVKKPIPQEKEASILKEEITTVEKQQESKNVLQSTESAVVSEKKLIQKPKFPKNKSNWEKFIGENLINKVGILITIIGVIIGAKFSIENNLISPLTRIILGYVVGLGLVGFGIKLKTKYENYSAVLISGSLAILYFITFAAYSFYGLFPQVMAFAIMLLFTVFGVIAALNYNKQIIAHIGLVGAYAIPFLLSNNSGNSAVLFSYMAIINIGILVIAIKKYWKPLYYVSFTFTWLIYISWALLSYEKEKHYTLAFLVIIVFFIIFYATFLSYKIIKSEKFKISDSVLLLLNSFIFYGLGYGLVSQHETGKELLGLFTLVNALIHFIVSIIIYKRKLADRNLFFLAAGLVLTFITIAIPVQLDGNWVTLLWTMEAALLFWIGRTKNTPPYEYLSYILMGLAFLSLFQDWEQAYYNYNTTIQSFLNVILLTSMLCVLAFGFINWTHQKHPIARPTTVSKILSIGMPILLISTLYFSFFVEIDYYWDVLFQKSEIKIVEIKDTTYTHTYYNYSLNSYAIIWLLNYTFLFLSILAFVTLKKLKSRILGIATVSLSILTSLIFLTLGLYTLSELRANYIYQNLSEYYSIGSYALYIRYIAFTFFALLVWVNYKLIRQAFLKINFNTGFELLLHTSILWIASSELLHWMDIFNSNQSYKLGLSILWGVYALLLIVLGIWKKKKYLRIAAIVLFGTTLAKLFLYDIASLNTISKTIVFVSLGILLLIISFLYNKYKHVITDENEE